MINQMLKLNPVRVEPLIKRVIELTSLISKKSKEK